MRCRSAALALLVGWMLLSIGVAALAQDHPAALPVEVQRDSFGMLLETIQSTGPTGVLALLVWLMQRGGIPVSLSQRDRDLFEMALRSIPPPARQRRTPVDEA